MITVSSVVGNVFHDKILSEKFQKLKTSQNCELIEITRSELDKKRLRRKTNKGTDVGVLIDPSKTLHNGDVLISNPEKFIVIKQSPEKVIFVKTKKDSKNHDKILVTLGHVIGNRHRPIQIDKEGNVIFPIHSDSEYEVFKQLFSKIIDQIELKIETRIFEPLNGMITHEH